MPALLLATACTSTNDSTRPEAGADTVDADLRTRCPLRRSHRTSARNRLRGPSLRSAAADVSVAHDGRLVVDGASLRAGRVRSSTAPGWYCCTTGAS